MPAFTPQPQGITAIWPVPTCTAWWTEVGTQTVKGKMSREHRGRLTERNVQGKLPGEWPDPHAGFQVSMYTHTDTQTDTHAHRQAASSTEAFDRLYAILAQPAQLKTHRDRKLYSTKARVNFQRLKTTMTDLSIHIGRSSYHHRHAAAVCYWDMLPDLEAQGGLCHSIITANSREQRTKSAASGSNYVKPLWDPCKHCNI